MIMIAEDSQAAVCSLRLRRSNQDFFPEPEFSRQYATQPYAIPHHLHSAEWITWLALTAHHKQIVM